MSGAPRLNYGDLHKTYFMEPIYLTADDLTCQDTHLQNIIIMNSNHYWDCEQPQQEEEPEVLYA